METKKEIFTKTLRKYLKANKEGKGRILDHVCGITGMHRKRVIARFREMQTRQEGVNWSDKRGRCVYYTPDVTAALKDVWNVSGKVCAERLHPVLGKLADNLRCHGHWKHGEETTAKLRAMSMGTMKARIGGFDKETGAGGRCMTKPSSLKELIPVRRGPWDDPQPGVGEIDTVAHCGSDASGLFAYTVQYSDISTLWVLLAAQMGKDKEATLESIKGMRARLPMPLEGLDPDTGSEFVNWTCKKWCDKEKIEMTRIRPGHKNDHGRIEQKHYPNVRRYAGYIRIDTKERLMVLQELYAVLEVYTNHFVPSMKCVKKHRTNVKRTSRVYDTAATPYARVMAHKDIDTSIKKELVSFHDTLDVFVLRKEIDRLRKKLFRGARFTKND